MSPRESTSPATTNLSAPIAKSLEEQLKAIRQQAAKITQPLQQAHSLETACQDVVAQLQQVFECDRALIYRLCDRSIDAFIDQFPNPVSGLSFNGEVTEQIVLVQMAVLIQVFPSPVLMEGI